MRTGREVIIPDEVKASIIENVRKGVSFEDAAKYAGISEGTLYNWKHKGKIGKTPEYESFYKELVEAEIHAKIRKIKICEDGAVDDPRLALELLARKYPEEWGKKDKILITNKLEEFITAFRQIDGVDEAESETDTDTEL